MGAPERGVREGGVGAVATRPVIPTGRILLVEDDVGVQSLVARFLSMAGFSVDVASTISEARAIDARASIDLALVDLILPDGDGLDLVEDFRRRGDVRTIVLTGRGSESERVLGLDLGADDYVAKPFSPHELLARIRAVLRRDARSGESATEVDHGWLRLDLSARQAWVDGRELELTRMEFDLLAALATRARRVCTRDELMKWVWGAPGATDTSTLTEHVRRLRRKVGEDTDDTGHIVSVRGVGYRFDP